MRLGLGLNTGRRGGGGAAAPGLSSAIRAQILAEWFPGAGVTLSGSNVQVLADQSGAGDANRNLSQLTGSKQPIYVASNAAYNNKPTLTMDGARWMQSGTWGTAPARPYRVYWVGSLSNVSGYEFDGISPGGYAGIFLNGASQPRMYAGSPSLYGTGDTSVPHISVSEWNNTAGQYARSAKTFSSTTAIGTATNIGFTLGTGSSAPDTGAYHQQGSLAHMLIVNSTSLTTAQHGEIMDYLGLQYGITVAA